MVGEIAGESAWSGAHGGGGSGSSDGVGDASGDVAGDTQRRVWDLTLCGGCRGSSMDPHGANWMMAVACGGTAWGAFALTL